MSIDFRGMMEQRFGSPQQPQQQPQPPQQPGGTFFPVHPLGPYSGPLGTAPGTPPGAPPPGSNGMPGSGGGGGDTMSHGGPGMLPGTTAINSLPQLRQDHMTQRWGVFGGGAPMPATLGDFRTARQAYFTAHPGQRPNLGGGLDGRHQRMAQLLQG